MAKERKASVIYEGNASQLVYAFPFDYLRKKFVKVEDIYTNITELTIGVDYTVEDKQVRLVKGIPIGHSVKIYRETTTDPLVEWQDASVLRSADLSLQEVQLLHLAEETADKVFDSGMSTAYGNPNCWDGQYKRIINALDPIEDGDVVTLRYIKANQSSLLNALKAEGAKQKDSIVDTGDNQNTRLNTTGDTQNKRLTTTGNSYVTTMTELKNTTTTKASEADSSAKLAKAWAMSSSSPDGVAGNKSAKMWAEEAKSSARAASSSQSAAKTSETNAKNSQTAAATSEAHAKISETNAKTSETNAATSATNSANSATASANSAKAAAKSEKNAKTWDPTNYQKIIQIRKADNHGFPVVLLFQKIGTTLYSPQNYNGGTFTYFSHTRPGGNVNAWDCPTNIFVKQPYSTMYDNETLKSSSKYVYPMFFKNTKTNEYYWGLVMLGGSTSGILFGTSYLELTDGLSTLICATEDVTSLPDGWEVVTEIPCTFTKTLTEDEWSKIATTNYVDNALANKIPTKTSQLTNDSGFADAASLEEEAKKWKDAYNNLRKRSTPTAFDDDELTVLMNTPIGRGTITLSQPYTDFDGLLIDFSDDDGALLNSKYISTAELNRRIARAKDIGISSIFLLSEYYYWTIWITERAGFSTTTFPNRGENCQIKCIYGVKLKEIT